MTVSEQAVNSIQGPERILFLDAVRGFALFGILLMNLEAFAGPLLGAMTGIDMQLHGMNRWADAFVYVFVQGKFWTLFSLLFGIGFALMHERAQMRGADFNSIYKRRLLALLAIGFVHYVFIWEGDILFSYAVAGFVLLWLLNSDKPIRWLTIAAWYSASLLLIAALGYFSSDGQGAGRLTVELAEQTLMQGHSVYSEALRWRFKLFIESFADLFILIPMTVAMFLLGVRLCRSGKITPVQKLEKADAWMPLLLLGTGIAMMLISIQIAPSLDITRIDRQFAQVMVLNLSAGALMCLGYFLGLRVLWAGKRFREKCQLLAPLGQMALSNYLAQSIVCTLIFNGYGLGFFQQLPRAWHIPFALALVSVQAIGSSFWLKRFTMGPAEYAWRWLTYGKRPKFVS